MRLVCRRRLWADFTRVGVRVFCCPHLQMAFHSVSEMGHSVFSGLLLVWKPTGRSWEIPGTGAGTGWLVSRSTSVLSCPLRPCTEFSFCLQDTLLLQAWEACLFFWEKTIVLSPWRVARGQVLSWIRWFSKYLPSAVHV